MSAEGWGFPARGLVQTAQCPLSDEHGADCRQQAMALGSERHRPRGRIQTWQTLQWHLFVIAQVHLLWGVAKPATGHPRCPSPKTAVGSINFRRPTSEAMFKSALAA